MKLKLAVATEDLHADLKRAIGVAASFQVNGVRLNTRTELNIKDASQSSLRQTLHFVTERQMHVAGLYCPTRHALYDQDYLEPRLEVIRGSMAMAQKLRTTELLVRCGRIPNPAEDQAATSATTTSISVEDLANPFTFSQPASVKRSERNDFLLLCELLNDLCEYGNHVGCTLNLVLSDFSIDRLQQLKSEIRTGPLQFCFDPATAIMTGAPVVNTYRNLYENIGYLRGRDALKDVDGAGIEVAFGDGLVAYDELLPTIIDADFQGWCCIERTGGDNRREDVAEGVRRARKILPAESP